MPVTPTRAARLALGLAACLAAAGCGSFDNATQRFANALTPYRIQVVQGNFISREQVEALRPGMSRQQVRDLLGTPLVTSVFHDDRWDYVFTLRRQGVEPQARRLTVYFKGAELERFEGDTMPTEAEFVAAVDVKRRSSKVPVLEATEEQLKRFEAPPAQPPTQPPEAAAPRSYPPLEPVVR
ncbi:outer membrane protein assembly factor BamE [Ramlibacter tataouinensis]|uniref:Outer membrane protein assembly factor BamE n=1 Tax=Ramlibacter tataouinensis (strain ATCC BAA-407 / DSM 14655 / LMG 21543 / TTB310) TaxID=365046 RepID=F5Y413_RAMTT|nr:outer membrane protein assembly factor BamE [Ramlibacter tataouinensis]AEG91291.1 Outer membrane lipoprotein omlA precursor-like protein [Ramlibacter tataouinensis TTB310]